MSMDAEERGTMREQLGGNEGTAMRMTMIYGHDTMHYGFCFFCFLLLLLF